MTRNSICSKSVSLVTENEEEEEEFVIDGVKSKQQDEEDKRILLLVRRISFLSFLRPGVLCVTYGITYGITRLASTTTTHTGTPMLRG